MFRNAGEYPAPLARDFRISADAERYYKSGEQFLYKRLPFWLASLVDRLLVLLLPLLVVLLPASRIVPWLYRWRVRSRIYRWYGVAHGHRARRHAAASRRDREAAMKRIDDIALAVNDMRTPPSFADQLYVLRDHIAGVRRRLETTLGSRT